jgi:hypothetical protein
MGLLLVSGACVLRVGGGGSERGADAGDLPVSEVDAVNPLDAQTRDVPSTEDAAVESLDAASANTMRDAAVHDGEHADAALFDAESALTDGANDGAVFVDGTALGDAAQMCSLAGSFATELLFDVSWNQTTIAGIIPLLAAGTGKIRMTVRLDLGGTPESASARLTACGATLPDFKASNALIGTENYAAHIPERAWEHTGMPHPAFGLSFGCMAPGCALTTDHVVATFGARTLPDDVWPGRSGALKQIVPVDHDGDGHPAITFISRGENEKNPQGMSYMNIPVTWTLNARALEADIAFRITGMFNGKIEHCDLFSGVVSSGSVEARAVGCRAQRDNANTTFDCASDQSSFLDQNLPAWQVRGGAFRARRVSQDANCTAVRAALQ